MDVNGGRNVRTSVCSSIPIRRHKQVRSGGNSHHLSQHGGVDVVQSVHWNSLIEEVIRCSRILDRDCDLFAPLRFTWHHFTICSKCSDIDVPNIIIIRIGNLDVVAVALATPSNRYSRSVEIKRNSVCHCSSVKKLGGPGRLFPNKNGNRPLVLMDGQLLRIKRLC